jgi:hypothetical protein
VGRTPTHNERPPKGFGIIFIERWRLVTASFAALGAAAPSCLMVEAGAGRVLRRRDSVRSCRKALRRRRLHCARQHAIDSNFCCISTSGRQLTTSRTSLCAISASCARTERRRSALASPTPTKRMPAFTTARCWTASRSVPPTYSRGRPRRSWTAPLGTTEYAADLAARAACQVGQFFEKQGDKDLAERLYRFGGSADCRERLVRLLEGRQGSGGESAAGHDR